MESKKALQSVFKCGLWLCSALSKKIQMLRIKQKQTKQIKCFELTKNKTKIKMLRGSKGPADLNSWSAVHKLDSFFLSHNFKFNHWAMTIFNRIGRHKKFDITFKSPSCDVHFSVLKSTSLSVVLYLIQIEDKSTIFQKLSEDSFL